MTDITISLNDKLELDTIIKESNIASNPLTVTSNKDYSLSEMETHTVVFDPEEPGEHNININGQKLSIKVLSTNNLGFYLDDFQDGNLSNRDTYTETDLSPLNLRPDSSNYEDPDRISWIIEDGGGLNVSNGYLKLSDSTDYVMHSSLNIGGRSWNKKTIWEFQVKRNNQNSNNGADGYTLAMDGTSYKNKDDGNNNTHFNSNRYYMFLNDGGRNNVSLRYNGNQIIGGDVFGINSTQKFKIIRYGDDTWELIQNSVSKGTVTHSSTTDISHLGIAGDSRAKIDVDYFLVY